MVRKGEVGKSLYGMKISYFYVNTMLISIEFKSYQID